MTKRESYDKYDPNLRISLSAAPAVERAVMGLVRALKKAGISYDEGHKPMSDVNRISIRFPGNGDFRKPELKVGGQYFGSDGCFVYLCSEPTPEEEGEEND